MPCGATTEHRAADPSDLRAAAPLGIAEGNADDLANVDREMPEASVAVRSAYATVPIECHTDGSGRFCRFRTSCRSACW
jgi:hypothetical protein